MNKKIIATLPIAVMSMAALTGCNKKTKTTKETVIEKIDGFLKMPDELLACSPLEVETVSAQAGENLKNVNKLMGYSNVGYDLESICTDSLKLVAKKTAVYQISENTLFSDAVWNQKQTQTRENVDGEYSESINEVIDKYFHYEKVDEIFNPYVYYTYTRDGYSGQKLENYTSALSEKFDYDASSKEEVSTYMKNAFVNGLKAFLGNDGVEQSFFKSTDKKTVYVYAYKNKGSRTLDNPIFPEHPIVVTSYSKSLGKFTKNSDDKWIVSSFASEIISYTNKNLKGETLSNPVAIMSDRYASEPIYNAEVTASGMTFDRSANENVPTANLYLNAYYPDGKQMTTNANIQKFEEDKNSDNIIYNHTRVLSDSTFYSRALDSNFKGYTYSAVKSTSNNKNLDNVNTPFISKDESGTNPYLGGVASVLNGDTMNKFATATATSFSGSDTASKQTATLYKDTLYRIDQYNKDSKAVVKYADYSNFESQKSVDDPFDIVSKDGDNFFKVKYDGEYFVSITVDGDKKLLDIKPVDCSSQKENNIPCIKANFNHLTNCAKDDSYHTSTNYVECDSTKVIFHLVANDEYTFNNPQNFKFNLIDKNDRKVITDEQITDYTVGDDKKEVVIRLDKASIINKIKEQQDKDLSVAPIVEAGA